MTSARTRVESWSLRLLHAMLEGTVRQGSLTLIDASGGERAFGDGGAPRASVRLHDPKLYFDLFRNPELRAGEAYMDGALTIEDGALPDFLHVFHLNAPNLRNRPVRRFLAAGVMQLRRLHQHNPMSRARRNAAHHYDLSNDFYRLFLDDDLNYSCAYFEQPGVSLETAQKAKLRHIAAKLRIESGMRVLDIGSGWGALAFYLAEQCGANVLGVTLSREQLSFAKERAKARGLEGNVEFRLADYRSLTGRFDRIVSVGMFEHVGVFHYDRYFRALYDLLADDGVALLHSIGTTKGPGVTGPWIRKYIFPGGYAPALSETFAAIERQALWTTDVEIWRLHYAETLRLWSQRFAQNRDGARAMFDERFCRMWEFYLASAEYAFRCGGSMVFQIQLAKRQDALPLTRDYMRKAEKALKARERD